MNDNELTEWQEARKKGFLRFALVNGLLWSLSIFFTLVVANSIAYPEILFSFFEKPFFESLQPFVEIAIALGVIMSVVIWFLKEHEFKKEVKSDEDA